jgi:pimeloyl-ACP methyl ester carboxylesterase
MATFVLVHGAWHGGWCWRKVVPLLERAGHRALAPDLPGHGSDRTPLAQVTLRAYADRVCQVAAGEREPVILVGHSMGGAVISQAAEQCPDSVRTLVYLAAFLLPGGSSLFEAARGGEQGVLSSHLRPEPANGRMLVADEGLVPSFYHDCSAEDVAFARARLVPQALEPLGATLETSDARFGRVPRVYVECLRDQAIPIALQRKLVAAMPCRKVVSLDTSHSPFFSAPDALARELAALA